jgi:hypothetical protein
MASPAGVSMALGLLVIGMTLFLLAFALASALLGMGDG